MECREVENYLEKSGCSFLENSQLLCPDIINNNTQNNNIDIQKFQNYLCNYQTISKNKNNYNKKYHFNFSNDKIEEQNSDEKEQKTNENKNKNSDNFLNYFLSNFIEIMYSSENKLKKLNDLSSDIKIKKESFFLTKDTYIGFKNEIGDNSCYVNVVLHLLKNMLDIKNILIDITQIESIKKENNLIYGDNISNENKENDLLSNLGEILNIYESNKNSKKHCK